MSYQAVQEWKKRVASKDGPRQASTRLVLLALCVYMDENGYCFPSIESLIDDTGLSKPTVVKHLKLAEQAGWIRKERHGLSGQGWARNAYLATTPKAVKPVNEVKPVNHEGGKVETKGGKVETKKAVKPVNSNYPVELSRELSTSPPTPPPPPAATDDEAVDLWFLDEKGQPYVPDIRAMLAHPQYGCPTNLPELCRNRWGQRHRGALPLNGLNQYLQKQIGSYGEREGYARMVAAVVLASGANAPYRYMASVLEAFPKTKPATIHQLQPNTDPRGSPPPPGYVEISALEVDGFRRYGLTDTDVRAHVNEHGRKVWLIKRERRDELWEIEAVTLKGSMKSSAAI